MAVRAYFEEYCNLQKWYFRESVFRGPEILGYANSFSSLKKLLADKEAKPEDIEKSVASLKARVDKQFKDYNLDIDRNLLASMLQMFHENVPLDQQPVYFLELDNKYKSDYEKYADFAFEKTIFDSKEKVTAFLNDPKAKTLDKDPVFILISAFVEQYKLMATKTKDAEKSLKQGEKLYIAGLREMNPDVNYYPDANFTMRLTYGKVGGYYPADAVYYDYYTTMDGIMQKEDPTTWEFIVPEKLTELYNEQDFGQYGNGDEMNVCFLTNHDITGGNSGSPVINGNGELIGLAFDGNWEAMSGDIAFEPELQRTINVDIRYVLFIIDKFAGAKNLIDEMTIVTEKHVVTQEMETVAPDMEEVTTD